MPPKLASVRYYLNALRVYFLTDTISKLPITDGLTETAIHITGWVRFRCPALPWSGWFGLTPDDRITVMAKRGFKEIYALDFRVSPR